MTVRPEQPADIAQIRDVNVAAFGGRAEADLVDALRAETAPLISLVATDAGVVVGHILFSPVTLIERPEVPIMGLAPMAVVPVRQRQGIGSALVRCGLARCRETGVRAVVVLGHPDYYPRFGFVSASRLALCSEYDATGDVFMAMEIGEGALNDARGTIRYAPPFAGL